MFGPESGKDSWTGLPFVYEKVRVGSDRSRSDRCDKFLKIFENEVEPPLSGWMDVLAVPWRLSLCQSTELLTSPS